MSDRRLMSGNDAIAEAAVRAGCRFAAGYPLTPATEVLEYLAWRLPEVGGTCIQAESELAAINMVYGSTATGTRAMTATSGLGLSLMQECLSQMCAVEIGSVVVNMARMGPGLGSLPPSQADYFLATRGAGHGDSRMIVLAPSSVQEAAELTVAAFDLAEHYGNPVLIFGDALLAQVAETVWLPAMQQPAPAPDWAVPGTRGETANVIGEYRQDFASIEESVRKLERKYNRIVDAEPRFETLWTADAEILVVAFGTAARSAREAVREARAEGHRVGLFRPVTLWPYPTEALRQAARAACTVLVVELSLGQMVEDVRLSLPGGPAITSFDRPVGPVSPTELHETLVSLLSERIS